MSDTVDSASHSETYRFWSKVLLDNDDKCWEWKTAAGKSRYGQFHLSGGGTIVSAHVYALYLTTGVKAKGIVLHSCDNKPCCNPNHLRDGSYSDNTLDAVARGRHAGAAQTHCKHGHEYTKENTRIYKGHRRCRACDRISKGYSA